MNRHSALIQTISDISRFIIETLSPTSSPGTTSGPRSNLKTSQSGYSKTWQGKTAQVNTFPRIAMLASGLGAHPTVTVIDVGGSALMAPMPCNVPPRLEWASSTGMAGMDELLTSDIHTGTSEGTTRGLCTVEV